MLQSGLLICLWENRYADKTVDFATCADKTGNRYNIELDNIRGFKDDFEKQINIFQFLYSTNPYLHMNF